MSPKRSTLEQTVLLGAVLAWPALAYFLAGDSLISKPLPLLVGLAVLAHLGHDASDFDPDQKPQRGSEASDERSVRISTAAFTVAALMMSHRDDGLRRRTEPLVLAALLLCVGAGVAEKKEGGCEAAVRRSSVTYSGGLLCLAVSVCLDDAFASPACFIRTTS